MLVKPPSNYPIQARRLSPELRRRSILEAAADFFAEFGFNGQLTELADRMGISHGLIFRYYPTKQMLVEAVYDYVHLNLWAGVREEVRGDGGLPLRERIERFLLAYLRAVDNPRWVRIGLYAGLGHIDINNKRRMTEEVSNAMSWMMDLVEQELGAAVAPTHQMRQEVGWHLYSSLIFWLMRKYVLDRTHEQDREAFIRLIVDRFLDGIVGSQSSGT